MSARREQKALRKQALCMRAALERLELAGCARDLRATLGWRAALKGASSGLFSARGLPILLQLVQRFPMIGSLAQFVAKKTNARRLRNGLRGAAVAWLAWQAFGLVRSARRETRQAKERR